MLVRDARRATDVPGEVVVGGYGDAAALARALQPSDRVFLVSLFAPASERVPARRAFVEAAVERRVEHVVCLSFIGAGADAALTHARSHGATEEMLARSGLSFTAVRSAMYTDEIPDWFDAEGRITGPAGGGRVSFSYRP
jgi:NAD(P)H dehydrogenase (quinone)